jgi:hypothetical protein
MGGVFSTHGGEEKLIQGFGGTRESDLLKDPEVYGRITLKWIFNRWDKGHGLD